MSMPKAISTFKEQQKKVASSRVFIITRLNTAACYVKEVQRKKRHWYGNSEELMWARLGNTPSDELTIEFDTDAEYPVVLHMKTGSHRVHRDFVFGSMWDITKRTRMLLALAQQQHLNEGKQKAKRVMEETKV